MHNMNNQQNQPEHETACRAKRDHRRIGSNLSLIEPVLKSPDVHRGARASKERAAESPSRRGGLATRDSIQDNSGRQAGSITPSCPATSPNSQSRDAESHDSASRKISVSAELRRDKSVKKSSSRWADRPVPVLQVEFPNPWRILANSPKNLKWSGRGDSNSRPLAPEARTRWSVSATGGSVKPVMTGVMCGA